MYYLSAAHHTPSENKELQVTKGAIGQDFHTHYPGKSRYLTITGQMAFTVVTTHSGSGRTVYYQIQGNTICT